MIVYGDPSYEVEFAVLLAQLQARVEGLRQSETVTLDALRSLLIFAGQVEQAAWDGLPALVSGSKAQALAAYPSAVTETIAAAFCLDWGTVQSSSPKTDSQDISIALKTAAYYAECAVDMNRYLSSSVRVTVKLPEGFAFYALYPEQYATSAQNWRAEHERGYRPIARVFGVRSIGTSLAAVVRATLRKMDCYASCFSVRPYGHPYARQVTLDPLLAEDAEWALVVDEGPGMSGSSVAAVAQALIEVGMSRDRIAFLPGHGGEPGGQGDENTKHWWATTPRYATALADMRWNGRTLPESLAAATAAFFDACPPSLPIEDFGGGLWRRAVYNHYEDWPAACAAFERPKYRITLPEGGRVLWKFAGLATGADGVDQAEALYAKLRTLHEAGWTPAPIGTTMGFVAMEWSDGAPLTSADALPDVLNHVGRYIVAVSGPPLTEAEQHPALARLADMLYWNTWESLGAETAERTRLWSEGAKCSDWLRTVGTHGDGHCAPHEWLRTPTGQLLKTDAGGHDADHTVIGRQAFVWDVAGVLVEWELEDESANGFLNSVQEAARVPVLPDILTFYRLAYAGFRVGQTSLCANMSGHDPDEQARLWRAYTYYRAELQRLLQG